MDKDLEAASRRKLVSAAQKTDDFTPAAALVRAEFGARSHRGRAHQENDDHYLVVRLAQRPETLLTSLASVDLPLGFDEYAYAAVVADGTGRAGTGSVAARLAISTLASLALRFGQWNLRIDPRVASEVIERSERLYRLTNETVIQRSLADAGLTGMAATLTGIYSVGTDLFVAHVGHSRCYLFRDGVLAQLTLDHTLRERLANSPYPYAIPVGQAIEDVKHILTHAVGAGRSGPAVIAEHFRLADDDSLLLCTNGLTDAVDDEAVADVLASRRSPGEQCDILMDLALANGAEDNTTVVVVNYHVPPLGSDAT
jgi:serine/threonine protein phosphatase PrpC